MQSRPGGRVKRGGEAVAGFDGRDESLLIGEHRFQPQHLREFKASGVTRRSGRRAAETRSSLINV